MEIMVSVSEWLDMYLYALTVFAGMGLFTNKDNTDAPNLTKYKGLAEKLADYGIDDKQFYKLATVLKNFLMQVIPERVRKVVAGECNPRVMDNLEMLVKRYRARAALSDVIDGMASITEWMGPTAAIEEWVAKRLVKMEASTFFANVLNSLSERMRLSPKSWPRCRWMRTRAFSKACVWSSRSPATQTGHASN